ncbi:MAG TPA: GNAT family N-acetyltransferase [Solirubrobacterales bacterium]|nr:GNAT family N-acetyltransferase [Solirubrobacterales bacterium]
MAIRWLSGPDRAEAGRIWVDLEGRFGQRVLACSWDWTRSWLEHYGDVVPHRFAIGTIAGDPRGIALVTEGVGTKRGPFSVRRVHLGTAGEPPGEGVFVEYNGVLVANDDRVDFAAALMRELRGEPGWHEVVLDGFEPDAAEPFLAAEPRFDIERLPCPTMDLEEVRSSHGDVMGAFNRATRWKVRRSLRGLGDVAGEWAETPDHAFEILDELIELHQARWTAIGQPGAFASQRFVEFHRTLISTLLPQGRIVLFRVRAASGTVGCLYGFVDRSRLLHYQSGLATYSDRQIRPIFVVCALCMQECLDRGLTEFDFMVGDSPHKGQLSTTSRELVWATRRRPALRWRVMDALAAGRRRLRALRDRRRSQGSKS